ncbi:hypothetical protein JCM11641_004309 [Rhodosporidiobolus odoratus]
MPVSAPPTGLSVELIPYATMFTFALVDFNCHCKEGDPVSAARLKDMGVGRAVKAHGADLLMQLQFDQAGRILAGFIDPRWCEDFIAQWQDIGGKISPLRGLVHSASPWRPGDHFRAPEHIANLDPKAQDTRFFFQWDMDPLCSTFDLSKHVHLPRPVSTLSPNAPGLAVRLDSRSNSTLGLLSSAVNEARAKELEDFAGQLKTVRFAVGVKRQQLQSSREELAIESARVTADSQDIEAARMQGDPTESRPFGVLSSNEVDICMAISLYRLVAPDLRSLQEAWGSLCYDKEVTRLLNDIIQQTRSVRWDDQTVPRHVA